LQAISKPFDEGTLLKISFALENNTDFIKRRPAL
jgi:Asp-tRNA(Asn)/Glu-tRNA(Gln) amidotransferase A subunit family amidase